MENRLASREVGMGIYICRGGWKVEAMHILIPETSMPYTCQPI